MKHNAKRFLSLLLALVMVIGLMPMSHAHAEEETYLKISEQVTSVEENATYVIALAGTKKALTNGDGRTDWGHHTMLLSDFGTFANATNLWTLESVEGGFKLKNANGYLAISRNAGSLDENGHVFELVYIEGQGWTIKSLDSNEYCNNLGGYNSCIGGWSGDGTKFDIYSLVELTVEEADPFGKLRGLWTKVSVDTETVYNDLEGLFEYAFDNNPSTRWHSNWQGAQDKLDGSNTFAGVIDFGAAYTISQFSFTPRQDTASGIVTQASLYVRETEEAEWVLVADHATFANDQTRKDMDFDAQPVRFVKFVAEQSNDGWVAVSEFDVAYFAPEHEHVYEAVVTAPTCTEGGYTTYTCATCGDSYVADETEALGHTEEVIPGTPATFDGNGLTEGVRCAVCGETLTAQETIPALDYNEGIVPIDSLIATAGDWQTGYENIEGPAGLALDNDFSTLWHTDWYGTSRENHWIQFELTDHYTVTGLRYKPRQHGNTNGTITQYEVQVSNDGETFETVASGRWEADRTWKIAEFDGVNAKYVRLVALDAVTDSGYVFASAAEIRLTGVPHEHVYEAVVTAPTCTEGGYTTYTCATCGDSYIADETEALGHTPVALPGYEATCTEAGLTDGAYCSVCDETIVAQVVIPATGHAFGDWTETKAPTCTEDGQESRYCANCDETQTRPIEKLGHSYEAVVTAPTCTEGGYTTYTCTLCGDSYIADETEALGHTPVTIPGYEATCTEAGLTDGAYCSVCDETITAQEVIPALGHSYENGSCVRCGEADPNAVTEIANGWSGYTTWVLTSDGTLTVSPTEQLFNGKCNMANYHKINGVLTLPWSAYAEQITKVVIEEGVNAVGQMAFYELPNLREVVLADSVEEIRNYAFKNTTSLTTINLEVVETICEGAFYGCSGLEGLTIAEGTVIEDWAFSKTPYASMNP